MIASTVIIQNDSKIKAWISLFQISDNLSLALKGVFDLKSNKPKTEFVVNYRAKEVNKDENMYDLSIRIKNFGNELKATYFHRMNTYSDLTKIHHPVSLGGEFQVKQGQKPIITLGGEWQLSNKTSIKAKGNTEGNVNCLYAIRFGKIPIFILTANMEYNSSSNKFSPGISLSIIGD